MNIILEKPLKFRGDELRALELNLDDLTGNDLIEVEQQIDNFNDGRLILLPEYSKKYLIAVAARALHMPVEVLRALNARDFTKLTGAVQIFLTGSASASELNESAETAPQEN